MIKKIALITACLLSVTAPAYAQSDDELDERYGHMRGGRGGYDGRGGISHHRRGDPDDGKRMIERGEEREPNANHRNRREYERCMDNSGGGYRERYRRCQ